jgi:CheY-like chemotaxis protein
MSQPEATGLSTVWRPKISNMSFQPGLRVLIIEDNPDLARLFSDLVGVMGFAADVAWNGRSGLDMVQDRQHHIVFCDLGMPGEKNGYDVAREVKADLTLGDTYLVAVTGSTDVDAREKALAAGFDLVLTKPVKFWQMRSVLDRFAKQGKA